MKNVQTKYSHKEYISNLVDNFKRYYNQASFDEQYLTYISGQYGDRGFDLQNFLKDNENYQKKLHPNLNIRKGEIIYSIERELCTSPIDFLTRRSRLAFLDRNAAFTALYEIVDIIAEYHEFDKETKQRYLKENEMILSQMEF